MGWIMIIILFLTILTVFLTVAVKLFLAGWEASSPRTPGMLFSKSSTLICLLGLLCLLVAPTFVSTCINVSGLSW